MTDTIPHHVVKAFNEQIIRTESYMIESQSSGLASGRALKLLSYT